MACVIQNSVLSGVSTGTSASATTKTIEGDAAQVHCSSSSSWPCWNERQSSTGMIKVKTITSLNALA